MHQYQHYQGKIHRLIPSRYPTVNLFDWAETPEELEQLAYLEGLTNDRLMSDYGNISFVKKEDWVTGPGSTPLMAAFTHFGISRFSDGHNYGVYYAGDSLYTAIAETKFHRQLFLSASNEPACITQMREYTALLKQPLVTLLDSQYRYLIEPDRKTYPACQEFARELQLKKEWGLLYPSVRRAQGLCFAVFRATALSIPKQAGHYDYIWDGTAITEVRKSENILIGLETACG